MTLLMERLKFSVPAGNSAVNIQTSRGIIQRIAAGAYIAAAKCSVHSGLACADHRVAYHRASDVGMSFKRYAAPLDR
jgi:hypothetical protein